MRQVLVALVLAVPAAALSQAPISVSGTTTNLSNDPAQQTEPSLWDQHVVWTDSRSGDRDIWLHDLLSGSSAAISEPGGAPLDDVLSDVGADYAVWTRQDPAGGGADVYAFRFADGQVLPVATGPSIEHDPAVSGSLVAYTVVVDPVLGRSRVEAKDLATGAVVAIAGSASEDARYPAVSGSRVAYLATDAATLSMYVRVTDVSTGATVAVAGPLTTTRQLDIDGDRVAYVAYGAGGDLDVHVHDLASGATSVFALPLNQTWPKISGDWVAFEDNFALLSSRIMLGHVPSLTVWPVQATGNSYLEDLQGTRVVYQDNGTGNFDVYLYAFTPAFPHPQVVLDCSSAQAAGVVPVLDQAVTRGRGRPLQAFPFAANAGPGLLCVDNGAPPVNSVVVALNGGLVIAPGQMTERVAHKEGFVSLQANNVLAASLRGMPRSNLRVRVYELPEGQGAAIGGALRTTGWSLR